MIMYWAMSLAVLVLGAAVAAIAQGDLLTAPVHAARFHFKDVAVAVSEGSVASQLRTRPGDDAQMK